MDHRDARFLLWFHRLLLLALLLVGVVAVGSGLYRWLQPPENALLSIVTGDYETAVQQLQASTSRGDLKAQTSLGNLYRFGLGVDQDLHRATRLYSESARAGDVTAMVNLGLMYRLGLGIEKDFELAYAWFNLARESGNAVGQAYMSELIASLEIRGYRVPDIRRTYATIANMPPLPDTVKN